MTATETLRRLLSDAGVHYDVLGDYTTYATSEGLSWALKDNYDGTLSLNLGGRLSPEEAAATVVGRTAAVSTVVDDDGVGDTRCCQCGHTVGHWFTYCPWCGSRFVERRWEKMT